ncbi:MAG: oxidoreductase, partial [Candidatus Bathyarchaeia archaeon]
MPRELLAVAPRKPVLVEYEEPPLKPNQVRIKSILSAEKHGTTLLIYRGLSPFSEKAFDPDIGLFMPKCEGKGWTVSF